MSKAKEQVAQTITETENVPETNAELFDDVFNETKEEFRQLSSDEILRGIQAQEIPTIKSSDLIGKTFDILDATLGKIRDDVVITFVIELDGETLRTSKSYNNYLEQYCEYFRACEREGRDSRLFGYTFEKSEKYARAGNPAIQLRKAV